jgi:GAF domain-containing protein
LEPLLQNILQNAVKILNCEAGVLYLPDEQTDELVFKVIVGPLAADLLGQPLPLDAGAAWRVMKEHQPVIENDVQRSAYWFDLDKQSGFESRALLAVPLQAKDRILGVLEVINRRDGLPFVVEDQSLLLAFASQGAVAIENARLYTMTDQALASRVEELSVMQRIDRELNASLVMERAMHHARLGIAPIPGHGWIDRNARGGQIAVAHQGYDEQLAGLPAQMLKLELPALKAAVENGLPQRSLLNQAKACILEPPARSWSQSDGNPGDWTLAARKRC